MRTLALVLGSLLPACVAASARPQVGVFAEDDRSAVLAAHEAYRRAWLSNEPEAVLATLTSAPVLQPPNSAPIAGVDAVRAYWWPADGSRTTITAFAFEVSEVRGSGDLAYVRGTSTVDFVYEKDGARSAATSRGVALTVLERQADGSWRIGLQTWNSLPATG